VFRGYPCGYNWSVRNGHRYAITSDYDNWWGCEAEAIAAGGHLVTINDAAENTWLATQFQGYYTQGNPGLDTQSLVWIGFELVAGQWGWVSGEPTTLNPPWWHLPLGDGIHAYLHTDTHFSPGTWWNTAIYDGVDEFYHARGIIEVDPIVQNIAVGDGPAGIAMASHGRFVYVANHYDDTLSVIGKCQPCLPADLNGDCYVNWADFGLFASEWLQCTNPLDPDCAPYIP